MMHQGEGRLRNRRTIEANVTRAIDGDEDAFRDLYLRHAGLTWRFAYALTGTRQDAVTVTSESFARTFTALRGAEGTRPDFSTLLLRTTRNTALDARRSHGDTIPPFEATEETLDLALAFASLPERWRSVLWLGVVEHQDPVRVADIIGLDREAAAQVTARARRGLRQQYLSADVDRGTSATCDRAVERLGPYVAGTLPSADIDRLERHLGLCATCTDRYARLAALLERLPHLAPALPPMLEDDARIAWAGAVHTASDGLGISRLGEKVLAGVAAVAAGVGVLGAALVSVSGSGDDDLAVAPIAPLVAELAAPRPQGLDLTIDLDPVETGGGSGSGTGSTDGRDDVDTIRPVSTTNGDRVVTGLGDEPSDGGSGNGDTAGPGSGGSGNGDGGTGGGGGTTDPPPSGGPTTTAPVVSVGTELGGVPVAVEIGADPGLTVGPVSVGSQPTPGTGTVAVGGPLEPLAPVVQPVNDVLNGVLGR